MIERLQRIKTAIEVCQEKEEAILKNSEQIRQYGEKAERLLRILPTILNSQNSLATPGITCSRTFQMKNVPVRSSKRFKRYFKRFQRYSDREWWKQKKRRSV